MVLCWGLVRFTDIVIHIAAVGLRAYVLLFQNFLYQARSIKLTEVLNFRIAGFITVFSKAQFIG